MCKSRAKVTDTGDYYSDIVASSHSLLPLKCLTHHLTNRLSVNSADTVKHLEKSCPLYFLKIAKIMQRPHNSETMRNPPPRRDMCPINV
jgi:hypothetical protein